MEARRNIWVALLLGWLVPGLGHFFLKRPWHGLVYATCIWALFAAGLLLSAGTAINYDIHPWYFACQLLAGPATIVIEALRGHESLYLGESIGVLEHQSGVVYAATAGVLNLVTLAELFRRQQEPLAPGPADTMRQGAQEKGAA